MSFRAALIAMGYRQIESVFMAKPVGRSLFVVHVELREWRRLIRGTDGEIHIYNRQTIGGANDYSRIVRDIREIEAHHDNSSGVDYDFAFTALNDLDLGL